MSSSAKRPPGRPRSLAARRAILDATASLVAERGYSQTTIDDLASRAGVGKQTIYRWWPTKADVVLEACAPRAEFAAPTQDHGGYAADLRAFLHTAYEMANRAQTADLLRSLMIEAQLSSDFGERFRTNFLEPRRRLFATILQRAATRGDLPADPAPATVSEIVFGTLWYRLLATDEPLDDQLADDLVATLTRA